MRINSNIPALNAHRVLNRNTEQLGLSLERLSSGLRINRASDDAAGLAISEKMKAQIQGLRQASRNSLDGISFIQTGEGALDEIHNMLKKMRELSVQGANGVYEDEDLDSILDEITELTEEIEKISENTEFNGIKILQGNKKGINNPTDADKLLHLQVGANKDEQIKLNLEDFKVDISNLGKNEDNDYSVESILKDLSINEDNRHEKFSEAITVYDNAVKDISTMRSKFGATQNRLESTISNLDNTAENLTAAKSRIKDVDMALEMSNFSKYTVLQQASMAMLGEANNLPQSVLQLLQ